MPKSLKKHSNHIDKKLQFRLKLYFFISSILIFILIFNVIRGSLRLDLGLLGLGVGVTIGIITTRMFQIFWHEDTKKVISRIDRFGLIILALYMLLEIFRGKLIGYATHNFQVGTIGLALLAGIMYGRVFGTRKKIIKILKKQQLLD